LRTQEFNFPQAPADEIDDELLARVETADLTDDQIRTRLKLLTAEAQKRQVQVENWLPGVHPELTLAEQQKADKARNTKAERRLGRIYEGLVKEVGGYGWIYGFITASGVLRLSEHMVPLLGLFRKMHKCEKNEGYRLFIVFSHQVVLGCLDVISIMERGENVFVLILTSRRTLKSSVGCLSLWQMSEASELHISNLLLAISD
jgi:hypothetical protein